MNCIGKANVSAWGKNYSLRIMQRQYPNGRIALQGLGENDEPFGVITTNLPDEPLEEGEFIVKTWSENQWVPQLLNGDLPFEDTGKRVPTGFVEAQIWRLKNGETT